ncbi:MAG: T9SS type A sorting domain-containing protein [Aureispira sp.]
MELSLRSFISNPSAGQVYLEWPKKGGGLQLQLINALGQVLVQQELDGALGETTLSLQAYSIGFA